MKIVATNRKFSHEYFVLETYEAGIKLTGTEIKSVRLNKININDSYVIFKNMTPFILNMHIAKYDKGNLFNHEEDRSRELLLHKNEIIKLQNKIKLQGLTVVPTKVYFEQALLKVEIALCKGKNLVDKREDMKKKDSIREMEKIRKSNLRNI